jgi:hypothetical protein
MLATFAALLLAGPDVTKIPQKPVIRFVGVSGSGALTFEAANPNAVDLHYFGYLPSSFEGGLKPGVIAPLYRVEVLRDRVWKDHKMGWCGTGKGLVSIPAKGLATFEVHAPAGDWEQFRVGVTWFTGADRKVSAVAWSNGVARKDVARKP